MQSKLPTDMLAQAARIMYVQHYNETGELLDLDTATHELGQWDDGQYFLRVNFENGHWWELGFGHEASEVLAAAQAPKH